MGLAVLQVTESWVEPGRGFCKCSGRFVSSFVPRLLCEGGEGGGWTLLLQQCKHNQHSESTRLCMWHCVTLMLSH